jgi:hypothetical protein
MLSLNSGSHATGKNIVWIICRSELGGILGGWNTEYRIQKSGVAEFEIAAEILTFKNAADNRSQTPDGGSLTRNGSDGASPYQRLLNSVFLILFSLFSAFEEGLEFAELRQRAARIKNFVG